MAKAKILFKLVTPTSEKVSVEVDEVMLPGEKGYFGVLPGHTPFLSRIGIGEVVYRIGDERYHLALCGGFVEVTDDTIIVLAKTAEKPEEIDVEKIEASVKNGVLTITLPRSPKPKAKKIPVTVG